MDIPCWQQLVQYGAMDIIHREYGNYITDTEQDYVVSLRIDLDTVPEPGGEDLGQCRLGTQLRAHFCLVQMLVPS